MRANSVLVKGILNYSHLDTYDRNFIDQTNFEAVVFSGVEADGNFVRSEAGKEFPPARSQKQK